MNMGSSVFGNDVAVASTGNLVNGTSEVRMTPACCGATISVGAENANVRAITIQLTDANGADMAEATVVKAHLFLDAGALAFAATGGSTGIAIGTDGALLAVVAKKSWILTSEADGDIDLTWTDTGNEAAYLGLELPNGKLVMSSALTNAT
jgi:hypothetical protein